MKDEGCLLTESLFTVAVVGEDSCRLNWSGFLGCIHSKFVVPGCSWICRFYVSCTNVNPEHGGLGNAFQVLCPMTLDFTNFEHVSIYIHLIGVPELIT